ncbi:MAG: recombinase family protein [Bacillota bacterium]
MAFYGRVSTEEQAGRGNIAGQVEFARRYFALHGPEENIGGFEMYLDEGVSGTIPLECRPEGARLLSDARAGKFSAVYFYRLDRLARSTQVVLNTYYELEELNIPIKSMTEAFDTGTPVGKFFMTLLASIAALERDTILERTQLGKERKARDGCWTSGPPPFGYRIGPGKRLAVFEQEAGTVRLIFRLYNQGMGMVSLARYLNARGIPTPAVSKGAANSGSGRWHAGHISIILRSALYTGEYRTMRRSQKGKSGPVIRVPPIISVEDFRRAEEILSENGHPARGPRYRQYLLRGIIFCGRCGLAMVGNSSGRGSRYYYRCTGSVNHGQGRACPNRQVRATELEGVIKEDIIRFFKDPGNIWEAVWSALDSGSGAGPAPEKEARQVERAIALKKEARQKILSLAVRSIISDGEAEAELKALAAELDLLEQRRREIDAGRRGPAEGPPGMEALREVLSSGINEELIDREIVRLLVERVEVRTENLNGRGVPRAVIYYRFSPPT